MNEIFHRTSIRKYQNKSVEDDKIEKILQAAMAAPSAGNQQPWEFYVIKDKTTLDKLSKTSPYASCCASAPLAFVTCISICLLLNRKSQISHSHCISKSNTTAYSKDYIKSNDHSCIKVHSKYSK